MKPSKKLFSHLLLPLALCVSSCGKDQVGLERGDIGLYHHPRVCTKILSLPLREEPGRTPRYQHVAVGEEGVQAKDFIYWLMTGADDLDSLAKAHPEWRDRRIEYFYHGPAHYHRVVAGIPSLEAQLLNDYRNASRRSSDGVSDRINSGMHQMNVIPWEYRVTGVKDFKIVALSPLFGLPAETSLNRFFSFYELKPKQIISSQSKTLLWGYSDQEQVTSIGQWLSMRPTAQPVMMLRLNTMPQEVPVKTRLVTILTTTDGKELRDTLQVLLK